jgi:D-beta-D-heptose 7-phosphate kinase / D-beta-D-heptose 1-phosphate adenosyltransferase
MLMASMVGSPPRVLVVGDLIIDLYIRGIAHRLSPEAPIPILLRSADELFLGGAANVALNLASLGCSVELISIASCQQKADLEAKWSIHGNTVATRLLTPMAHARAPVKTRFYCDSHCMLRVDDEHSKQDILPFSEVIGSAVMKVLDEELAANNYDAIAISDYDKGAVGFETISYLVRLSEARGIPLFIDTKKSTINCLGRNTTMKPNMSELNSILSGLGHSLLSPAQIGNVDSDPEPCVHALSAVSEATGAHTLVLTASGLGAAVYHRQSKGLEIHKTPNQDARDVSGAGDTFFASYIHSWCETSQFALSCQAANYYAGCAVKVSGTYLPTAIDIYRYRRLSGKATGMIYLHELVPYLDQFLPDEHRQEYRLGFTNGCFDILHPGHMSYLREAKACCDLLVCGLNSDQSVRQLKGESRPVNQESYRAQALLALGSIDLVIIFHDPTPETIIHTLKPDVLIKGGDYSIDKIVGADFVRSYGGSVVTMPLVNGFSTTNIIQQVLEKPVRRTS